MVVAAWRKAVAEFVGAYTLIFVGAGSIVATQGSNLLVVAFAHGLAIAVMVSALAHVSGGHFNPAVTFGALVSGQLPFRIALVYWSSQLVGGLAGALTLLGVFPSDAWGPFALGTPGLGANVSVGTGILVEAVLTFFLVFVIFGTGIDPKGTFNAVGGFAIGLTITMDILVGGSITGAAMNPARWLGPAVVAGVFDNAVVYWIGPLIGGAIAAILYTRVFLEKTM